MKNCRNVVGKSNSSNNINDIDGLTVRRQSIYIACSQLFSIILNDKQGKKNPPPTTTKTTRHQLNQFRFAASISILNFCFVCICAETIRRKTKCMPSKLRAALACQSCSDMLLSENILTVMYIVCTILTDTMRMVRCVRIVQIHKLDFWGHKKCPPYKNTEK